MQLSEIAAFQPAYSNAFIETAKMQILSVPSFLVFPESVLDRAVSDGKQENHWKFEFLTCIYL